MSGVLCQLRSGPGGYLGKSDLDQENSKYKALEVKTRLTYLRNSKKSYVARAITEGDRSWR